MFETDFIPFDSWDGTNNDPSLSEQTKLEEFLGKTSVVFNTYQNSIAAILEVLGSRSHIIPAILPITAAPDTIAGVLRAGADPILLDIHPQTLQIDPVALSEVLDEVKTAVVILTRPGGSYVDEKLLELTKDLPTITDTRLPPHDVGFFSTFEVCDLGTVVGSGAVVYCNFTKQVQELKMVRNGVLGLSADINPRLAQIAYKRLREDLKQRRVDQRSAAHMYTLRLEEKLVIPTLESRWSWPYFIVQVENADKVMVHMRSYGISVMKPVFPLHYLSEMNRRWQEPPSYPVAESLHKKLIALPTHAGILDKVDMIVEKLLEVAE